MSIPTSSIRFTTIQGVDDVLLILQDCLDYDLTVFRCELYSVREEVKQYLQIPMWIPVDMSEIVCISDIVLMCDGYALLC